MSSSPNDFYSAMSQVAVSLLALLFVSFQIAHSRWVGRPARQYLAVQTSFEFMTPLLFSLSVLLPVETLLVGSVQITVWQISGVLISALGLIIAIRFVIYARQNPKSVDRFLRGHLRLQWMAIFGDYIPIMIWSIIGNLALISVWMIWMLVSGSIETWWFFSERE